MKEYLFLKGPLDGKWLCTDDRPWWQAYERDPSFSFRNLKASDPIAVPMHRTVEYQSHKILNGEKTTLVYLPSNISPENIFDILLKGYKPETKDER